MIQDMINSETIWTWIQLNRQTQTYSKPYSYSDWHYFPPGGGYRDWDKKLFA